MPGGIHRTPGDGRPYGLAGGRLWGDVGDGFRLDGGEGVCYTEFILKIQFKGEYL